MILRATPSIPVLLLPKREGCPLLGNVGYTVTADTKVRGKKLGHQKGQLLKLARLALNVMALVANGICHGYRPNRRFSQEALGSLASCR